MKNAIFISPNFPENYWHFCHELSNDGVRVLGIGDEAFERLRPELVDAFTTTGLVHILSVSGSHITLLAGLVACLASAKEYRIPEGVTEIQGNAFECCESLTSVTIPKSMKVIGDWAFQFCRSLTSVVIPDGMVEIGEEAFSSCESLTTIEIPASVTKIWYSAFLCCPDLTIYASEGSEAEKYTKDPLRPIPFQAQ